MKPNLLDDVEKNEKSAKEKILSKSFFPMDFIIVFVFNSVDKEQRLLDHFVDTLKIVAPYNSDYFIFYTSDQEHAYVISWIKNDGTIRESSKTKYLEILNKCIALYIGSGEMHIMTYYGAKIYPDNSITAERCVLDIHINKNVPLDKDFFNVIFNKYSLQVKDSPIKINNKVLHVRLLNDIHLPEANDE